MFNLGYIIHVLLKDVSRGESRQGPLYKGALIKKLPIFLLNLMIFLMN